MSSRDTTPAKARDPATGRFLPGRSGNPEGGRRRRTVERAILAALSAPVTIEGADGRPQRLSKLAAAARQVADRGVAGDAQAGRLALDLALKAEQRVAAGLDSRPARRLPAEDAAILARLIDRLRAQALTPPAAPADPDAAP